ncbi:MAG: hypothetical protein ACR2PW_04530 [Gammaproteobacteria bacterium]
MAGRFGQSRVNPINIAALLQRSAAPVPPTALGGIAAGLNPIATALAIRGVESRQRRDQEAQAQARQAAISQALAAGGGRAAQTVPGGALGQTFGGGTTPTTPEGRAVGPINFNAQAPDRSAMARALAESQFPELQTAGLNLLLADPKGTNETFGQPVPVTGPSGNPRLAQFGNRGSQQLIEGLSPEAEAVKPLSSEGKLRADFKSGLIGQAELDAGLRRLAKPGVEVNVGGTKEQTEFEKEFGKGRAKAQLEQISNIDAAGEAARRSNAKLEELDRLLDEVNVGPGAGTRKALARVVTALGFETEIAGDLGAAEAAEALANEMALEFRNPSGGAGMPGAMSDKDREFLQAIVPSASQTHEGRKLIVAARRKLNQRNIEVKNFAREWRRNSNGRLGLEFEVALEEKFANNPNADLFSGEEIVKPSSASESQSRFKVNIGEDGSITLEPKGP